MKKFNFLNLCFVMTFLLGAMAFVSCVDDNDDTEAPFLEVTPTTLVFSTNGTPVEGSQSSFNISTNRHWKATVKDDKSWVTLSATEGEGSATVQVSIPENITDQASIVIEISNKVGPLKSEVVTIRSGNVVPEAVLYNETVGTTAVPSPYPLVDAYTGWNKSGPASANVTYTGQNASIRASGLANIDAYPGASGPNVIFFGAAPSSFIVNNLTLTAEQTNLRLRFGGSYSLKAEGSADYDNTFDINKFAVSLSADGIAWTPLVYTKNNGDAASPYWVLATADFTLKQPTTKLYIKFTALASSAFRLDDITLSTGNGGQEISFGDAPEPGDAKPITIPELNKMMTATQAPVDATADRYFEAVVQNDVTGNNYSFNNLILATENATTAGHGITLYGSQVEPTLINVQKGDKVKVTLYKDLAQIVNFQGMYEVTGDKNAVWCKVEKMGTATITPIVITADKLAEYQGMAVTIQNATTAVAGIWANEANISSHSFTATAVDFPVFCKKGATAFVDVPFTATTGSISGLASVNKTIAQLVPRNLEDVQAFNSTTPSIVSVAPTSVSLPATGGTQTIEVTVVNQGSHALSVSGLSGILSATISGTTVTVTATANSTASDVDQNLTIALTGTNSSVSVPVTVKAQGSSSGYSLISTLENLVAGKYLMSGYVEKNNNNEDLTPYTYQIWTGSVSFTGTGTTSNSDLKTVSYQYDNNQLTPKSSTDVATTEIELVAVSGKANTYYIKVGNQYLYNSVATTNRRLYFQDATEGAEWVFMNKSNGTGVTASNNGTYLITAGATYDYIRSYKTETQTKVGIFFFKKN